MQIQFQTKSRLSTVLAASLLSCTLVVGCSDTPLPAAPNPRANSKTQYKPPTEGEIAAARNYVLSRKTTLGKAADDMGPRSTKNAPDGVSYSYDDGYSIANEVGALEMSYDGEQAVLSYRMDPSGTVVDRITIVVSGQQAYTANLGWNSDGTELTGMTQTTYVNEAPSPSRYDFKDAGGGWQEAEMRVPLGHVMFNAMSSRLNLPGRNYRASMIFLQSSACGADAMDGLMQLVIFAIGVRRGGQSTPPTPPGGTQAVAVCMRQVIRYGASNAEQNLESLVAAGFGGAINSWQSTRSVWDKIRRLLPKNDGGVGDGLNNVWFNKTASDCNATAGERACTSMSSYLQM
jgi:hypothetical protein